VDAIAGTSMGAVVGGIYATGLTSAHLEQIVRSLDWVALFSGRPDRRTLPALKRQDRYPELLGVSFQGTKARFPPGILAEHGVNRFLIEHLAPASYAVSGEFDRLPIPFRAVATDLGNGERFVLERGDLARAVRASMSIPVFFPPVDWEGRKLIDGLATDNLATDVARQFGATVTVAIDIGSPELEPEEYDSSFGVASQLTNVLTARRSRDYHADPDVYVRPDLGKHASTDYSNFDALIEAGYQATRQAIPQIREKLQAAGVTDLSPRTPPHADRALEGTQIVEVVTRGNKRASEKLLRRTFNIPLGRRFEMMRGLRAFDKVGATGLLQRAWMQFEPAPEGLRIVLTGGDAAPNRVGVGVSYSEWEKARGWLRLRNQNTLGFGEQVELLLAASDAETIAQASLRGDRLFLAGFGYRVSAYSFTDKPRFFDEEGNEVNRGRFERQGGRIALQAGLERWGFLEAGARFGHVRTREQAGIALPEANDTVGALFAGFTFDTLDDHLWPEQGGRFGAQADWNLDDLGATRPYWRLRFEGRLGRGLGRKAAMQLDGVFGLSGQDLPAYDHFRVGGPTLLPGYRFEELKGAQALAGSVSVRYTVLGSLRLVGRAGGGNVFAETQDITLSHLRWGVAAGLYFPTRVGPVSLEFGVRDGGKTLVSFALGWY
jgi:NTE family protein